MTIYYGNYLYSYKTISLDERWQIIEYLPTFAANLKIWKNHQESNTFGGNHFACYKILINMDKEN